MIFNVDDFDTYYDYISDTSLYNEFSDIANEVIFDYYEDSNSNWEFDIDEIEHSWGEYDPNNLIELYDTIGLNMEDELAGYMEAYGIDDEYDVDENEFYDAILQGLSENPSENGIEGIEELSNGNILVKFRY